MSRFRHAVKGRDQHIFTLRAACVVLLLLLITAMGGWMRAPEKLTIHNPPDLRKGSTRPWWEIPPPTVYGFTYYIFQQLNAWPKNGKVDYPARIQSLSAYLTPQCKAFLEEDAKVRGEKNELTDRVRVVYEIPGRGYSSDSVKVIDRDNWVVKLDLVADEYYLTEPVKRAMVRYPIKVVRWDGDSESNPFGMALDCYEGIPQRLSAAPEQSKTERKGVF